MHRVAMRLAELFWSELKYCTNYEGENIKLAAGVIEAGVRTGIARRRDDVNRTTEPDIVNCNASP